MVPKRSTKPFGKVATAFLKSSVIKPFGYLELGPVGKLTNFVMSVHEEHTANDVYSCGKEQFPLEHEGTTSNDFGFATPFRRPLYIAARILRAKSFASEGQECCYKSRKHLLTAHDYARCVS